MLGPDGALYITTSDATNDPGTDRILRVVPSLPPAFAAPSADHTVAENINPSTVVATFAATDPEGGEVRYTLGGTDAGSFNLADERLGELRANQAFDFETRRTYEVVVDAHDPYGLTDSLTLTVSVTNLDETGGVTFDKQRPIRNQPLTATLVDPDGVQGAESWTWHRSTSRGGGWGEPIAGAGSNVFTPVAADREHYLRLRATVEYSDAHGAKTVQAITGLAASNMAPVLPDSVEPVSIPENTRAGSNVGGPVAASDAERDPLSYSLQGSSDFVIDSRTGQIKVADGVVLDFDAGQTSYTLTVGVDDGFGGQDSVTVTITITGVNEAPVANDDVATTDEDSSIEIAVRTDIDPDAGDTVTLLGTLPDAPDHGSATVDTADNRITYTPSANYHGPDSFSYRVQDGGGLTADATVAVTVKGVNDAPEFVSATAERSVPESAQPGANVGVPVTANDVDGDLLGYRLQGAPEFEIDEDTGQIQVAPGVTLDRERTPSYEVTVTASDGKGGTDSITVTINVSNVNEAPTAVNDTATTDEDQSVRIDVLANDTDPDTERAALTVSVLRDPLDGTARVESDRTITYTPNANFAGENSFTYRLSDGSLSDDGSVTVTVEAVNDAPAFPAATAERSVPEDAEADDNVGTPVTARDIDSATLIYRLTGASEFEIVEDTGQIQVAPGVTLDRERTPSYEVTVTASDGKGGTDSITVTINVSNVNEAPTAVNDTATTDEDQSVRIDVLANDTDPDTERAALTVSVLRDPLDGTARVESDRTITYTPNANFAGENSFTYRLSDGSLSDDGSVTVTVEAVNDAPAFPAATAERSVPEDAEADDNVGTPVTARDIDSATLIYRLTGASEFEIVEDTGQIQVAPGVTLDRERTPSYEVTVTASDGKGGTDSITVTINVSNVNEAPTAVNDTATTDEDQSVRIDVLANDTDPDTERAALTVSVLRDPLDGTARVESDRTITYTPNANFAGENSFTYRLSDGSLSDDGSVTVTVEAVNDAPAFPAATAERSVPEDAEADDNVGTPVTARDIDSATLIYRLTGASEFEIVEDTGQIQVAPGVTLDRERTPSYEVTVTASDGKGGTDSITVTINVSNVNEAPTAVNDTATTDEDQSVRIDVLANDTDPDTERAALTVSVLRDPLDGTARVESDRTITYTPNANFAGENSFTYRLSDGSLSDDGSVTVTVEAVNDAPAFPAATAERTVSEQAKAGDPVGAALTARDIDSATLIYRLTGASEFEIVEDTGQIQVAPGVTLDRERTPSYEVTVTASDGKGGTDSITVTINVSNVNEAPTAVNDTATTDEDQSVRIDVLANDTDPDTERAALTVSVLRDPLDGTARVESDRTITYTPNANFAGENSFTYRLSDGSLSDAGSVTVTVEAVNDAPAFPAATTARSVPEDAEAGDNVGAPVTATDIDNAMLTYRLSGADASSFDIDSDGQITVGMGVMFDAAMKDEYAVTVTARDPDGDEATVEVTITVTAGPVIIITGGGGGGGGGGPTPSEVDFEWTVDRDIEELDGGNDRATGVWSDGTTLWVADNADGAGDAVYAYNRASGERLTGREFTLAEANRAPRGFWSDGETVWVSDSGRERLFAYRLADGERLEEREFELPRENRDARGIWSDEETMWVLDGRADALFAYDFESGEQLGQYALDPANDDPRGIWSDGVTIWVSDHGAKRLIAYRLPAPEGPAAEDAEPQDLERVRDEEFPNTVLSRASNNSPRGIWSDGDVMYVADESDDRVYSYNMPDAIDARLASLTLSGVDIGEFDPGRTDYEAPSRTASRRRRSRPGRCSAARTSPSTRPTPTATTRTATR